MRCHGGLVEEQRSTSSSSIMHVIVIDIIGVTVRGGARRLCPRGARKREEPRQSTHTERDQSGQEGHGEVSQGEEGIMESSFGE